MAAKFRNRVRQVLYRPIKKKSRLDYVTNRLVDAEKVLDSTVGGALRRKKRHSAKRASKEKEE